MLGQYIQVPYINTIFGIATPALIISVIYLFILASLLIYAKKKGTVKIELGMLGSQPFKIQQVWYSGNTASDVDNTEQSIFEKCNSELKEYEVPKYIKIVPTFPYTQNNKYDFRLLEQQGNGFVEAQNK